MKMAESSPKGYTTLWEKGEIAHYERFLLFPQCCQKTCTADILNCKRNVAQEIQFSILLTFIQRNCLYV